MSRLQEAPLLGGQLGARYRSFDDSPAHPSAPTITVSRVDCGVAGWCVELRVEGLASAEHARRAAELLSEYVGEPVHSTSTALGLPVPDSRYR